MCELFGMSSSAPATVSLSLTRLAAHGGRTGPHRDGWGVGYYEGFDVRLIKEAEPAAESEWIRFLDSRALRTPLAVAHIRLATEGERAYRNTQPFSRELGGRMHLFAHNGWLPKIRERIGAESASFHPIGETDSEYAFCTLLEGLRKLWANPDQTPKIDERFALIAEFAQTLTTLGPANFLYSDGEALFAHGDRRKNLTTKTLEAPGLLLQLRHCHPAKSVQMPAGIEISGAGQWIALVASVPLSDEDWRPLGAGELIALKAGRLIKSNGKSGPASTIEVLLSPRRIP